MEQTNKLNWIKKVTPLLYNLSLAGICLYIALRCRSWANLLLPWETGFVLSSRWRLCTDLSQPAAVQKISGGRKPPSPLTYWVSVATFVVIYLSMSILCADLLQWLLHFFLTDAARQTLFILRGSACLACTLFFACYGCYKTTKIVTVQYPLARRKSLPDRCASYSSATCASAYLCGRTAHPQDGGGSQPTSTGCGGHLR